MINFKVLSNIDDMLLLFDELGDQVSQDMSKALNRAAHGVKTDVTRYLAKKRDVDREDLNDWFFTNAYPDDLEAKAIVKGQRLGFEQLKPEKSNSGIAVNINGKVVKFRHAFYKKVFTDEEKTWARVPGKKPKTNYYNGKRLIGRFPVKRYSTQAVPQMADDDDVVEVVAQKAHERAAKQFDHLMDRLIKEYS